MSYIGKIPATGNFVKLDAISVVNGQASYTMQSNSVNFTPESANHMLVSLNGVIQAPGTSFTVSGSTITFASALSTGDVINFIMVYGNVLDIGTPSDDTVSAAKLKTDSVIEAKIQDDAVTRDKINAISTSSLPSFEAKGTSGQTEGYIQLNCAENSHGIKLKSPPHSAGQSYTLTFPSTAPATDKFLKTDNSGNLSFADAGGSMASGFANTDVNQTIQSSSLTDLTNVTASITPSSTSSKVLIVGRVQSYSSSYGIGLGIVRDSTVIYEDEATSATYSGDSEYVVTPFAFIDSPSTTSSTTYKVQVKTYGNAHTMQQGGDSNICLVEILG